MHYMNALWKNTFVYKFALKKFDFRGACLQLPKIGGGQRKLRGGEA